MTTMFLPYTNINKNFNPIDYILSPKNTSQMLHFLVLIIFMSYIIVHNEHLDSILPSMFLLSP